MKTAIVLFNLGGPDSPESVKPFLFNLFNDRAIVELPQPLRWLLARTISARRAPVAREIYAELGGSSPLLANTVKQADALTAELSDLGEVKCFPAMRYWKPFSEDAAQAVKDWAADRVVLLPLYPQYSGTTTGSSLKAWRSAAGRAGLTAPETGVCCYPEEGGLVAAMAGLVRRAYDEAAAAGTPRVLFSAHGLPKKVIEAGDPYRWQIERTAAAVARDAGLEGEDWLVCYQSRVGPLEWIRPYTEDEIRRAGSDGAPLVVAPIAFVSEHSETLVELDIEYRQLAREAGVPAYVRAPTVSTDAAFIAGLAGLVRRALGRGAGLDSGPGGRLCPVSCGRCALAV